MIKISQVFIMFSFLLISCSMSKKQLPFSEETCGPQTPRDISQLEGTNKMSFEVAPASSKLNLCNVHFHKNAEHKGPGFSINKGLSKHGGFACNQKVDTSKKMFKAFGPGSCKGIETGDTVEVHWVHSSCDVSPGETLGACLSKNCTNPKLRVETQVFLLVNDSSAPSFLDYAKIVKKKGYYQSNELPSRDGVVEFLGSTTGPKYNKVCSPFKVNWSVTPNCQTLNIASLHSWCKNNVFNEDHAHGVRNLVEDKRFLSPITK